MLLLVLPVLGVGVLQLSLTGIDWMALARGWHKFARKQAHDRSRIAAILFGKYRDAAFTEWRDLAKFEKLMRGKLGQALNFFSGRAVSAVFSAWQEESSAKKKMNTKLKNAVQKLRNRQGLVSVTPSRQSHIWCH